MSDTEKWGLYVEKLYQKARKQFYAKRRPHAKTAPKISQGSILR